MTTHTARQTAVLALAMMTTAACQESSTALEVAEETAALVAVTPEGGASDVDPEQPIVLTFDHAVHSAMTDYVALHQGGLDGPAVPGTAVLSSDGTQLVFTPDQPLQPAIAYTIHVGGGMMDAQGHIVDMESNGPHMGGQWASGTMMNPGDGHMGGGGMGGGTGGGMEGGDHPHMGAGWEHPDNGSYGMIFTFTTAG